MAGTAAALLFGFGTIYCWDAQRRACNTIALDEAGIWRIPPKGALLFIAWGEVRNVKADDMAQRLIVSDRTRARKIWLEYQLENFSVLRDYVLQHAVCIATENAERESIFHCSWALKVVMFICLAPFLFVIVVGLYQGAQTQVLFASAFVVLELMVVVRDPLNLAIHTDRIILIYPGWRREIAVQDILSVRQDEVAAANGNVSYPVTIELKNGKPVKLGRFREGSLAVLQALQRAIAPTSSPQPTSP